MPAREPGAFQWIELAALKGSDMMRNHFVKIDDAKAIENWRYANRNRNVYASICRFQEPNRGSAYLCDFVLDVDAKSKLQDAKRQTEGMCDALIRKWQIDPGWIGILFSGSKGFHISVPSKVFGRPTGRHVLQIYRAFATRLKTTEGFSHVDDRIYQPARILRLANSVYTETSLYKYPLEYAELVDLELEYICEMAREPRDEDTMAVPAHEAPKAMQWWQQAVHWYEQHRRQQFAGTRIVSGPGGGEGGRYPPCVRKAEEATLTDGSRHEALLTIARFYAAIGMAPEEMAYRLKLIDERNPIRDENYVERLTADAKKYAGFKGCPNDVLAPFCDSKQCFLVTGDRRPGPSSALR